MLTSTLPECLYSWPQKTKPISISLGLKLIFKIRMKIIKFSVSVRKFFDITWDYKFWNPQQGYLYIRKADIIRVYWFQRMVYNFQFCQWLSNDGFAGGTYAVAEHSTGSFLPKKIFILWSEGLVRFGLKHLKVSSISDIESGSKLLRIFKYSRFPTDRCRVRRLRWYAEKFCTFEN